MVEHDNSGEESVWSGVRVVTKTTLLSAECYRRL